jgi:hypothetical protein
MMLDSGGQHLSELNGGMINLFGGDADGLSWKQGHQHTDSHDG